jgi:hypothetical protein
MKTLIYENDLFGKVPVGIGNGNIELRECDGSEADNVIIQHHYSHKATTNRFKSFRVNDGTGYLQLGYGIRPHVKHNISKHITPENYAEFDRMWLSDDMPKNSESQVISLLLSYIKQVYPRIVFIITYADESVGNTGIIYQATNAIPIGWIYVDFYQLPSGERIHPVTMWHRHGSRAWDVMQKNYPGIKHIKRSYKQFRYLYVLNKKYAKEVSREIRDRTTVKGLGQFQDFAP